jgi:hypothetical protein
MSYKDWKMNNKHLTEFLMAYVSTIEKNNKEEKERLMQEIIRIFDGSYNTEEEGNKEEIINLILMKMKEETLTHLDVATYTRDLVIHGFK